MAEYNARKVDLWSKSFYEEAPSPARFWFLLRMNELMMEDLLYIWSLFGEESKYKAGGQQWEIEAVDYLNRIQLWKKDVENIQNTKTPELSYEYANALKGYFIDGGSWEWVPLANSIYNAADGVGGSEFRIWFAKWSQEGPISRIVYEVISNQKDKPFQLGKVLDKLEREMPDIDEALQTTKNIGYGLAAISAVIVGAYIYERVKR